MLSRRALLTRLGISVAILCQAAILNPSVSSGLAASESPRECNDSQCGRQGLTPHALPSNRGSASPSMVFQVNRGKHRQHFHAYADRRHGALLKTSNDTGLNKFPDSNIGLAEADKERLSSTIIIATTLYCAAALYGILHLPIWNTFSRMYKRKRVAPSSEIPEDNIELKDLSAKSPEADKKTVRWSPSTYVKVQ